MEPARTNTFVSPPIPMRPFNKPISMAMDANAGIAFDASLVAQLACPACLGDLKMVEASLECVGCGRAYPIVDGIPVLIASRAQESRP
jgi:uncharacterized protein YbaR (Trm112 family)